MTQQLPLPAPRRPRRRLRFVAGLAAVASLALAACGGDDPDDGGGLFSDATEADAPAGGARTIEVVMTDLEFSPAQVEVAPSEVVSFTFTNEGAVTHDAVIGDEAAQAEHEDEMRSAASGAGGGMDGMAHGDEAEGDESAITVEPGGSGQLTYTFAPGDDVLIGCHQPGHYDAGMRIDVTVAQA